MFRFALSVGSIAIISTVFAASPPSVPNTYPQGQERSPNDREFFVPMATPSNLADVTGAGKVGKPSKDTVLLTEWFLQFQRPLGTASGLWLVRR